MRKFVVAKTRKRSVNLIIELSSQENVKNATVTINTVNLIQRQKNAFIQRDSFQFEITKNIVSEKQSIFIKNRIADKNARARNKSRNRDRKRNRTTRRREIREKNDK